MRNCPYCNQQNPEENQFCGQCGKEILLTTQEQPTNEREIAQQDINITSKKSGIIRFIISILVLLSTIIPYVYYAYYYVGFFPKVNSFGIIETIIYRINIVCIIGLLLGLILDILKKKKKKLHILFSVLALSISIISCVSIFIVGTWAGLQYSQREEAYRDAHYEDFSDNIEEYLTPEEEDAKTAISTLKSVLRNPNSLQIYSITCCDGEVVKTRFNQLTEIDDIIYQNIENYVNCDYLFKIDCSAENGFGGTNRETYYIACKSEYASTQQLEQEIQFTFKNFAHYLVFPYDININKLGL